MAKKVFIISLVVFLVIGLGLVAQKFFFSKKEPATSSGSKESQSQVDSEADQPKNQPNSSETTEKALDKNKKLLQIVEGKIAGLVLAKNKSEVAYSIDGKFLSIGLDGDNKRSIGNYPFESIQAIKWSPDLSRAMVNDANGFNLYDLGSNQVQKLKDQIDSIEWAASGDKIYYKFYEPNKNLRALDIANPDGSEWKTLVPQIPFKDVKISVSPAGDKFCYYQWPDSLAETSTECMNNKGEEKFILHKGVYGADYLWSPSGKKVLTSFVQEKLEGRLALGVMNDQGGEFKSLSFPTLVQKCVWSKSETYVFCGMMSGTPQDSSLPEDWINKKVFSSDTFWKINVENGKKERIIDIDQLPSGLDAANVFLDDMETRLFFTDRKGGGIYRIKL